MDENLDFKAMYLKMMNAAEDAIRILIKAQRECEEMYLEMDEETEDPVDI